MKASIAGLSSDKRLQLVLVAFCFGAFLEGAGGGGAPVAIAGSFLIGLGFKPFQAATLCLIANTAPVAWGGVGNPIRTLAGVTGLPEAGVQRDGRTHSAAALADPAALAGAHDGRLARDAASLAGAARERRLLRGDAVLLVQLPGRRTRRHRRGGVLAARDGGVPEGLEAARAHANGRRTARAP